MEQSHEKSKLTKETMSEKSDLTERLQRLWGNKAGVKTFRLRNRSSSSSDPVVISIKQFNEHSIEDKTIKSQNITGSESSADGSSGQKLIRGRTNTVSSFVNHFNSQDSFQDNKSPAEYDSLQVCDKVDSSPSLRLEIASQTILSVPNDEYLLNTDRTASFLKEDQSGKSTYNNAERTSSEEQFKTTSSRDRSTSYGLHSMDHGEKTSFLKELSDKLGTASSRDRTSSYNRKDSGDNESKSYNALRNEVLEGALFSDGLGSNNRDSVATEQNSSTTSIRDRSTSSLQRKDSGEKNEKTIFLEGHSGSTSTPDKSTSVGLQSKTNDEKPFKFFDGNCVPTRDRSTSYDLQSKNSGNSESKLYRVSRKGSEEENSLANEKTSLSNGQGSNVNDYEHERIPEMMQKISRADFQRARDYMNSFILRILEKEKIDNELKRRSSKDKKLAAFGRNNIDINK